MNMLNRYILIKLLLALGIIPIWNEQFSGKRMRIGSESKSERMQNHTHIQIAHKVNQSLRKDIGEK